MNYKVYNTDTKNWMTYRKDGNGRFEVVRRGLPTIKGIDLCSYDEDNYVCETWCYEPRYESKKVYVPRSCTRKCVFRKEPKVKYVYIY